MRNFPSAIKNLPHPEERPQGASRKTHDVGAAIEIPEIRSYIVPAHPLDPVNGRFEGSIFDIVYPSTETTASQSRGKAATEGRDTDPASIRKIQ